MNLIKIFIFLIIQVSFTFELNCTELEKILFEEYGINEEYCIFVDDNGSDTYDCITDYCKENNKGEIIEL